MVIWITGLSGSGKTTLGNAIFSLLKPSTPGLAGLDGDVVRQVFDDGLGYREEDRVVQISRIQRLAKLLSDQGLTVVVGALYASPALLTWNRQNIREYFEVYLEASLEALKGRDAKGLYSGVKHVVGVDIPWHQPEFPDMVINMDEPEHPEALARRVIAAIPQLMERQGAA